MTTAQQRQHASPVGERDRRAAVARFYAQHAARLRAFVARHVHTTGTTVEDACQNAWTILLEHPEIELDHHGLRWLTTVATREAWTQARRGRELPARTLSRPSQELDELAEPAGPAGDPADLAVGRDEHYGRRRDLQALKPREIAELTGSSYTAINRRITEGRARLRDLAARRGAKLRRRSPRVIMSELQIVTYGGKTVAACTAQRFFLTDELAVRPPGDPELTFVVMMCAYALDVAVGVLPGPYRERDVRRYARACLIPNELLERATLDYDRAARALGVPVDELRAAQRDHKGR